MKEVCECFTVMIKKGMVNFYSSGTTLFMPFIPDTNFRYNNCPCCLSEVREIETTKKELDDNGIIYNNID